ncbi:methylated-DNA--[protein]-cysteine S-methyltransferase [Brevibacterium atlanticum]|uniref:methylated-DNA--[protein]-cysteine S-methyltransferase n=1 Tax=Brevibacterium atlanticum TaxID=2697563 RepID=UPI0014218D3A|nr:methylated-DNA--[protein]-cysteine S-methyltransferase [Brevibacterium atlanticum]
MTSSATLDTFVGSLTVTSDDSAVVGLEWTTPAEAVGPPAAPVSPRIGTVAPRNGTEPTEPSADSPTDPGNPLLNEAVAQLRAYFDGRLGDFDLPVDFGQVSDVARAVLTTLSERVPAGTTMIYGELAEASSTGIPARAVGGITGLNPIPIIVPCHRVVASDGLGGYSGGLPGHGLETKRRLLEFEDALPQPLF